MLRVGIVGTGQMAATMVAAMRQTGGFTPVAVLSGSASRAVEFAQALELEAGFDDMAGFVSAGLDLVYIANANADHAQAALGCIDAGLPLFVEKPMALTQAEGEAILTRAKAQNLLVLENLWVLALPAYRALKQAVENGQYGRTSAFSFDFSLPVTEAQMPGLFAPKGGGALRDRAVYGLAMAIDLLGPVLKIQPDVQRNMAGVETQAALQLVHEGGSMSQISVSFDAMGRNNASLAMAQDVLTLGPGLAAEHVTRAAAPVLGVKRVEGTAPARGMGGLKQRLKQQPVLRRLKAVRAAGPGQFHSYGVSPYTPILQELQQCLQNGKTQSSLVPWSVSTTVARLVDEASSSHD